MFQDRDATLGVQKRIIVIKSNGESIGGSVIALLGLLPNIKPGTSFGLECFVAGCSRRFGFGGDILWR